MDRLAPERRRHMDGTRSSTRVVTSWR
jgi:hypothetical protein